MLKEAIVERLGRVATRSRTAPRAVDLQPWSRTISGLLNGIRPSATLQDLWTTNRGAGLRPDGPVLNSNVARSLAGRHASRTHTTWTTRPFPRATPAEHRRAMAADELDNSWGKNPESARPENARAGPIRGRRALVGTPASPSHRPGCTAGLQVPSSPAHETVPNRALRQRGRGNTGSRRCRTGGSRRAVRRF